MYRTTEQKMLGKPLGVLAAQTPRLNSTQPVCLPASVTALVYLGSGLDLVELMSTLFLVTVAPFFKTKTQSLSSLGSHLCMELSHHPPQAQSPLPTLAFFLKELCRLWSQAHFILLQIVFSSMPQVKLLSVIQRCPRTSFLGQGLTNVRYECPAASVELHAGIQLNQQRPNPPVLY